MGYKVVYINTASQMQGKKTVTTRKGGNGCFYYILPGLDGASDYLFKMFAYNLQKNLIGPSVSKIIKTRPAGLPMLVCSM